MGEIVHWNNLRDTRPKEAFAEGESSSTGVVVVEREPLPITSSGAGPHPDTLWYLATSGAFDVRLLKHRPLIRHRKLAPLGR